jgi:hypothetical protein
VQVGRGQGAGKSADDGAGAGRVRSNLVVVVVVAAASNEAIRLLVQQAHGLATEEHAATPFVRIRAEEHELERRHVPRRVGGDLASPVREGTLDEEL